MYISQSSIQLSASHQLHTETVHEEKLNFWIVDPISQKNEASFSKIRDLVTLSEEGIRASFVKESRTANNDQQTEEGMAEDPKLQTMRLTLEALTGKKIKIGTFQPMEANYPSELPPPEPLPHIEEQQQVGWGLEYDSLNSFYEMEQTTFNGSGTVLSQNGKTINFNLNLTRTREFYEESRIHIRAGDARLVDPLVINFNGESSLSDLRFDFDLDSDGSKEKIAHLGPGSGFLVLDRNKDGRINNGTEMFGPETGHGFSELASFDHDQNGWLDENDSIFEKLQVWIKEISGNDYLAPLKDLDIGALFLDKIETPFQLNSTDNQQLGQIRETGLFLREDGSAGSMQEILLVV